MTAGFSDKAGFGISQREALLVPNGESENGTPIDLGRPYAMLVIACANPNGGNGLTYSIWLSDDIDGELTPLNDDEGDPIAHPMANNTPFWRKYFVGAVRRIQLRFSNNSAADVTFHIIGVDAGMR